MASNDEASSTVAALNTRTLESTQLAVVKQRINAIALSPDAAMVYFIASADSNVELWSLARAPTPSILTRIHEWTVTGVDGPGAFSLFVDPTGARLVEQYCGSTCVSRSINLGDLVATDLGNLHDRIIGVAESGVVVLTGCCTDFVEPGDVLASTDAGDVTELVHGVWAAKVVTASGGSVVVALRETSDGTQIEFLTLGLDGAEVRSPYAVTVSTPGSFPIDFVGSSADQLAGSDINEDNLLLVPGGRVEVDPAVGALLPLTGGNPSPVTVVR